MIEIRDPQGIDFKIIENIKDIEYKIQQISWGQKYGGEQSRFTERDRKTILEICQKLCDTIILVSIKAEDSNES